MSLIIQKKRFKFEALFLCLSLSYYLNYFVLMKALINAGSSTKFVNVLTTNVIEVSQPKALVPPKSLKQNMTKPATNTKEV